MVKLSLATKNGESASFTYLAKERVVRHEWPLYMVGYIRHCLITFSYNDGNWKPTGGQTCFIYHANL